MTKDELYKAFLEDNPYRTTKKKYVDEIEESEPFAEMQVKTVRKKPLFDMPDDDTPSQFPEYDEAWHQKLDELKSRYPIHSFDHLKEGQNLSVEESLAILDEDLFLYDP